MSTHKKPFFILFLLLIFAFTFSGCNAEENGSLPTYDENEPVVLRILIEGSIDSPSASTTHFDLLIRHAIADFEVKHENVTFIIEQIPHDAQSREVALTRLRSELIAGEGPDIYLLPTRAIQSCDVYFEETIDQPLFRDVAQAMRNGMFYDISKYYDADTELNKDSLVAGVMDAGVLDGARYVLPMRYNYPVAYVNMDKFNSLGLDESIFSSGIVHLLNTVVREKIAAHSVQPPDYISNSILNFYPDSIDYQNQEILLTADEVVTFLESYQTYASDPKMFYLVNPVYYPLDGCHWTHSDGVIHFDNLENAVQQAVIAKIEGFKLGMYPLTAEDGTLVADITFYGAVDAYCARPDIAYAFLSTCFSEKNQWGTDVQANSINSLMSDGFPVLTHGAAEAISRNIDDSLTELYGRDNLVVNDNDVPLLHQEVSVARFPINLEDNLANVIAYSITPTTTPKELNDIANNFIQQLEWHLGEG